MDSDLIQAMVAKCLVDPDFLPAPPHLARRRERGARRKAKPSASLEQNKEGSDEFSALAACDLFAPECLERLALFRGFIVKVKHNQVRQALPLTFRLLPAVAEELAFFRYYAPAYLAIRAGGPLALEAQVQLMAKHLHDFLEQDTGLARKAIADVLTHELALWTLRSHGAAPRPPRSGGAIAWRGRLEIRRYGTDVLHACGALAMRNIDPARDLRDREHTLAYWRPADSDAVEFFEIDELTAFLFAMVDGRRTLEDIAERVAVLGMNQIGVPELEEFFQDLAARGFLEAQRGRVSRSAAARRGRNLPCA